jgi:hypothetical protein
MQSFYSFMDIKIFSGFHKYFVEAILVLVCINFLLFLKITHQEWQLQIKCWVFNREWDPWRDLHFVMRSENGRIIFRPRHSSLTFKSSIMFLSSSSNSRSWCCFILQIVSKSESWLFLLRSMTLDLCFREREGLLGNMIWSHSDATRAKCLYTLVRVLIPPRELSLMLSRTKAAVGGLCSSMMHVIPLSLRILLHSSSLFSSLWRSI